MIGKTISHYKILEKLGEGGMGVVYKAEDTKLQRHVALKFLPQEWTRDPDAKARFMNEARAASALDHNNICNIHEIDETEDGQLFIVMAFYEGETVREKIERGPLKLDEATDLAIQIAEGLTKAHEKEIVHRDLKPANVLVTEDGVAKIVDFGLAKLAGRTMLTKEGTTLGTASYMSPEQARGEVVDHRTDIFSLGVLLYEMITGQQPFKGDYEQAVVYSILNEDPEPPTGLRTGVPRDLERAVFKCLQKSPDVRYQSVTDLLVDLRLLGKGAGISQRSVPTATAGGTVATTKSKRSLFALGAIGLAGIIALLLYFQKSGDPKPIRLSNLTKITHAHGVEENPTWSPDGRKIAYVSNQKGTFRSGSNILITQLSGGEPVNMTKDIAADCAWPSWSPDGSQIAFNSRQGGRSIWVMPAIGGTPRRITSTSSYANPAWSADGTQLAYVVTDSTGVRHAEVYALSIHEKQNAALPGDQYERVYLSWRPDGNYFAYADADNLYELADISRILISRVSDETSFQIANDASLDFFPIWSMDGSVLYFVSDRGGTTDLWQVKLSANGSPIGEPEQISFGLGLQSLAFSADGAKIAFSKKETKSNLWRIPIPKPGAPATKWADVQQLTFESSRIGGLDLSPNGKEIYFQSDRSGNWDLWSMPTARNGLRQLTTGPADDNSPSLSPDGSTLAFVSERSGKREIWTMPALGGRATQITNDQSPKFWPRWSPDGKTIAYNASDSNSNLDLWIVPSRGGAARQITTVGRVWFPLWWPDGQSLISRTRGARLLRFPITGGDPEPLTTPGVRMNADDLRWSSDKAQIYFIGNLADEFNVWSLSVVDGSARQLTDFSGRYGRLGRSFATDGGYLYFTWLEETGDIWVMDVEREE